MYNRLYCNGAVRGYPLLSCSIFCAPQDVREAFDLLADSMRQGIDHMDDVVTYFEHTYIRDRRLLGRRNNYREASFSTELFLLSRLRLLGI